jgi:hypothetical protein
MHSEEILPYLKGSHTNVEEYTWANDAQGEVLYLRYL